MQRSDGSGDRDESDTQPDHGANPAPDRWLNRATLTRRGALIGMTAVAGIAAVDVGAFAFAGGWLRPDALTPSRFADRFEQVYGRHDGFRRNHAKGLSASGTFQSNGAGTAVCEATVFKAGTAKGDKQGNFADSQTGRHRFVSARTGSARRPSNDDPAQNIVAPARLNRELLEVVMGVDGRGRGRSRHQWSADCQRPPAGSASCQFIPIAGLPSAFPRFTNDVTAVTVNIVSERSDGAVAAALGFGCPPSRHGTGSLSGGSYAARERCRLAKARGRFLT